MSSDVLKLTAKVGVGDCVYQIRGIAQVGIDVYQDGRSAGRLWFDEEHAPRILALLNGETEKGCDVVSVVDELLGGESDAT